MNNSQLTAMRSKLVLSKDWDDWWDELIGRTPKTIVKLFNPESFDEPIDEPEPPKPSDVVPGASTLFDLDRGERKLLRDLREEYTVNKAIYESQVDRLMKVRELIQLSVGKSLRPCLDPNVPTREWIVSLKEAVGLSQDEAISEAREAYRAVMKRTPPSTKTSQKQLWLSWLSDWKVAMAKLGKHDAAESVGTMWMDDLAEAIITVLPSYAGRLQLDALKGDPGKMTFRLATREIRMLMR